MWILLFTWEKQHFSELECAFFFGKATRPNATERTSPQILSLAPHEVKTLELYDNL